MRKPIAAVALMACIQMAAAADPGSSPDPSYDTAERELAAAFDGAGLKAMQLGGRPLVADGLMLAQQQPPGTIGGTTESTTTTTTTARTRPLARRPWYHTPGGRAVLIAAGVVAVVVAVVVLGDDDEEPVPSGTGAN